MDYLDCQGLKVPVLGFGTWKMQGHECFQATSCALQLGYRLIDTAQIYDNESEVGDAISKSPVKRENILLTTKVWIENLHPLDLILSVDQSLRKLQTDYLDLLLIHWPSQEVALEESLKAMEQLVAKGKTRFIGVSNFTQPLIKEALSLSSTPLLTNQVECHPYLQQNEMRAFLKQNQMFCTGYSPLAQGEIQEDETLKAIAHTHNKEPSQIALRFLIQKGNTVVIPKASNKDHCKSNIDIFDFTLSDEEIASLEKLDENRRLCSPSFAPRWDSAKK